MRALQRGATRRVGRGLQAPSRFAVDRPNGAATQPRLAHQLDINVNSDRCQLRCSAVAEAPPASYGLQVEVAFEEPSSPVPPTYITTNARVIASMFFVVFWLCCMDLSVDV